MAEREMRVNEWIKFTGAKRFKLSQMHNHAIIICHNDEIKALFNYNF